MKRVLIGVAGLGLMLDLGGGVALADSKVESIKVTGWHCGACSAKTETALKSMKGVETVSADRDKSTVTVKYDDKVIKHADLTKAIADAGFQVAK